MRERSFPITWPDTNPVGCSAANLQYGTRQLELGDTQGAKVLEQTLIEEEKADEKLNKIAKSVVNLKAKAPKSSKPDGIAKAGKSVKKIFKAITG